MADILASRRLWLLLALIIFLIIIVIVSLSSSSTTLPCSVQPLATVDIDIHNAQTESAKRKPRANEPPKRGAFVWTVAWTPGSDYYMLTGASMQCIRNTSTKYELVVLADGPIDERAQKVFESAGARVLRFSQVISKLAELDPVKFDERVDRLLRQTGEGFKPGDGWFGTFNKLLVWTFIEYDRVVLLDSDVFAWENVDELMLKPELSAVPDIVYGLNNEDHNDIFNAGVMVLKPSMETFEGFLDVYLQNSPEVAAENYAAEQGFLNYYFKDVWNRLPIKYNVFSGFIKKGQTDATLGLPVNNVKIAHHVMRGKLRTDSTVPTCNPDFPFTECTKCCLRFVQCLDAVRNYL